MFLPEPGQKPEMAVRLPGSRRKPGRRLRQQELIIRERAETIQGTAAVTIRTLLHSLKTDGIHRNRVVPKEFPMVSRGRMMMCL